MATKDMAQFVEQHRDEQDSKGGEAGPSARSPRNGRPGRAKRAPYCCSKADGGPAGFHDQLGGILRGMPRIFNSNQSFAHAIQFATWPQVGLKTSRA